VINYTNINWVFAISKMAAIDDFCKNLMTFMTFYDCHHSNFDHSINDLLDKTSNNSPQAHNALT
jgi:hypothetical protein